MTGNGLFYCPRCGKQSAVWGNDYNFEDYCMDGDGIVTNYTCTECNSDIQVATPFNEENEDGEE